MSKYSIKINGSELRSLLEQRAGSSIYDIAADNNFSRNLISEAIRKGKASPIVQMIANKYGITPDMYIYQEEIEETEEAQLNGQISIDDLEEIKREYLKEFIKEALREVIREELK